MGMGYSLILTEDGNVAVFGDNAKGQLGVGDILKRWRPVVLDKMQVFGGGNIVMVCAEYEQSACVTKGRLVVGMGIQQERNLATGRTHKESLFLCASTDLNSATRMFLWSQWE